MKQDIKNTITAMGGIVTSGVEVPVTGVIGGLSFIFAPGDGTAKWVMDAEKAGMKFVSVNPQDIPGSMDRGVYYSTALTVDNNRATVEDWAARYNVELTDHASKVLEQRMLPSAIRLKRAIAVIRIDRLSADNRKLLDACETDGGRASVMRQIIAASDPTRLIEFS